MEISSGLSGISQSAPGQISRIFSKHSTINLGNKQSQKFQQSFDESHISVPDIFENQTFLLPKGPWSLYKTLGFRSSKDEWLELIVETLETNEKEASKRVILKLQASYALFNQPTKSPYLEANIFELSKQFILRYGLLHTSGLGMSNSKEIQTFRLGLLNSNRIISQFQLELNYNKISLKSLGDFRNFLFCPAWEIDRSLTLYGLRLYLEEVAPTISYAIRQSTLANDLTLNKNFNSAVFFCYIISFYYVYSKSRERITSALIKWKEEFYDNELKSMFSFYTFMFEMFDSFPAI